MASINPDLVRLAFILVAGAAIGRVLAVVIW